MKTKLSRILTLALVLTMVLSMSITAFAAEPPVAPATVGEVFEDGNYTLTVKGNDLKGKTVTAVRMFTVTGTDSDGDGICYQDDITYTLDDAWKTFFTTAPTDDGLGGLGQTAPADGDYSKAMHDYVFGLNTDTKKAELAHKAKAWVAANPDSFPMTGVDALRFELTADTNTVTFTGLKAGYYLVYPESGSTKVGRATDAILDNIPLNAAGATTDPVLELKTEYPTVVKKVEGQDATTAQIGDTVNFTLTSKVPNMEEYKTYKFTFQDTMSAGLTFNGANTVHVYLDTVADANEIPIASYNVSTSNTDGATTMTVAFTNLKTVTGIDNSKEQTIIVIYSARLNQNAVIGGNGNSNSALVQYSNNPKTDGTGASTPSVTKVYTFPITIDKYTANEGVEYGEDADITHLPGAVFELWNTEEATVAGTTNAISLVAETTQNTYHVASYAEITGSPTTITQVTTPADGKITIKGLKAGTYWLHEITPPAGYNRLATPVKIEITATMTKESATVTYTINDKTPAQVSSTIPVLNEQGAVLPGTGSIGTIGLTILGVGVVVLAVFLPSRKKKAI